MITGTMNVPMTLEKANYYNALEKRDEAMPLEVNVFEYEGKEHKTYKCPMCGEYIYNGELFCKTCGQRLDTENIAL